MRLLRRLLLSLVSLMLLAAVGIQAAGHGYFWNALQHTYLQGHNTAHIDDATSFQQAVVAGGTATPWVVDPGAQQKSLSSALVTHLQETRSAAFLVAHRGRLLSETYFPPYGPDSRTNAFSITKTVITMLLGAAVADGFVDSLDAPLARYVPEYAQDPRGNRATLAQLSAMTSGHDWTEHYYLPLNPTTRLYFGGDAAGTVLAQGFERDPGTGYEYSSASTQLLGLALQRALQARQPDLTLSTYLSQKLWLPLGMEGDASWSLDRPRSDGGMEMAYCCLHSSARNFARLGQLLLQNGEWNGRQLLPAELVARMTRPNGFVSHYGHGLWMDPDYRAPFYFLQGHLGQYVIVVPSAELVVVRLGQIRHRTYSRHPVVPDEVYDYVDEALRLVR